MSAQGFAVARYRARGHLPSPLAGLPDDRRHGGTDRGARPGQPGCGQAYAVVVLGPHCGHEPLGLRGVDLFRRERRSEPRLGLAHPQDRPASRRPPRGRRLRRDRGASLPRWVAADPGHRARVSGGQCQRTVLHTGPDGGEPGSPGRLRSVADEIVVAPVVARLLGWHVGQVVPFGFYSDAQQGLPGFGTKAVRPALRINMKIVGLASLSSEDGRGRRRHPPDVHPTDACFRPGGAGARRDVERCDLRHQDDREERRRFPSSNARSPGWPHRATRSPIMP